LLHQSLWLYSVIVFIAVLVSMYTHQKEWLSIPAALFTVIWVVTTVIIIGDSKQIYTWANGVTLIRCIGLFAIFHWFPNMATTIIGIGIGFILALDILDGYLARKLNQTTLLGEYLDKETDALMVLFNGWMLFHLKLAGWWLLIPGTIRYVYFAVLFFFLPRERKEARIPWARGIAAFLFGAQLMAFFLPSVVGILLVLLATILVCISFILQVLVEFGWIKQKAIS
jgi:phosphatidylglycerophosphate synthase